MKNSTDLMARLAALATAALLLGGCGLIPVAPDDPSRGATATASPEAEAGEAAAGWMGRSGVGFDMELPDGWRDFTARYAQLVPDTVLAAYLGTAPKIENEGEPFATISTDRLAMDQSPRAEVYEDLDSWAADMTDPVRGPEGGIETATGGAGWWGSVTGDIRGTLTTIHAVHIFHGYYELMVLIETYEGDDADAADILEALGTVEFTAPAAVDGRHGAPRDTDGRWHSYCDTFSAAPQPDWTYNFQPALDTVPQKCHVSADYLGGWVDATGPSQINIRAQMRAGQTEADMRREDEIPAEVGQTTTTANGFTFTLMAQDTRPADAGSTMTRVVVAVDTPDGTRVTQVAYYLSLGEAGTVMVLASAADGNAEFATDSVEAFAASITAEKS